MRPFRPLACLWLLAALPAEAFSIETTVTRPCHERITLEALSRAGRLPETAGVEDGLREELAFTLPPDAGPWTLAVLVGVRDNDLKGAEALDFNTLAAVHEDPFTQFEHCLRAPGDDDAAGDLSALASCRAHIRALVAEAQRFEVEAPTATQEVQVALAFRTRPLALRSSGVLLGRALHAIQDSFAHAWRSDDYRWPRSVFNYVEAAGRSDYARGRDGTPHVAWMDACGPDDPTDLARAEAATQASFALVQALGSGDLAPVDVALDTWLTRDPLCDTDPTQCRPLDLPRGCSAVPGGGLGLLPFIGLCLALLLPAPRARAASEPEPEPRGVFGFYGGLSIDRAGAQGGALVGYRFDPRWRTALHAEWSPWLDLGSGRVSTGTANVYATVTWQWLALERLALRSALGLGASVLTSPMVGARPGSAGPFGLISLISVALPVGPKSVLELRPDVVVALPDVRGVPIVYRQYRFMVTWERTF